MIRNQKSGGNLHAKVKFLFHDKRLHEKKVTREQGLKSFHEFPIKSFLCVTENPNGVRGLD